MDSEGSARPSSSPRHPGPCSPALTQGEGSGAGGEAVESHAVGRDTLVQVQQRVDRKDHHTTWNRHAGGRAQHAPHTTPPPPQPRPLSPMGLGTARAWVQSKGRLVRDQMTGCTFCVMFREMATMEHVSCRTATRLGANRSQRGAGIAGPLPRRPARFLPPQQALCTTRPHASLRPVLGP